ncbi:putative TBC domain protein [Lasiodiplodia theobromae]|uniref:Uncharacterized protein n=1 Tax=Lasiodiplodia theobromae TaxID=45133 RepID=A0A5N5DJ80_9PEZI|nr:putative TBC domain protein [Lasiodiplodia theobromae]KAB2577959.1 hypothetical protein DBV05_g3371 [Lasiodiplodia theobromae]KAF4539406.1 putative TBC domain protein [Lasiodiplodia theobromae]
MLLPYMNPRNNPPDPTQSQAMDESSAKSLIAGTASLSLGDDGPPDSPSSSCSPSHEPPADSSSSSPADTHADDADPVAEAIRLRTAFFRAAVFLQDAYTIWREHTYDHSLVPIMVSGDDYNNSNDSSSDTATGKQEKTKTKKNMQIHLVHDADMEVYDEPWELCEMSLFDFPYDKMPNEMAREALLATCMCEDAAVVMARMIERVLGPISEISVETVDEPPLTMHLIEDNPASSRHGMPDPAILNHYAHHIRLALPGGLTEEYAFDITSAQYGWGPSYSSSSSESTWSASNPPCPLVSWQTYVTSRIRVLWFGVPAYSLRVLDDAYVVLGLRVGGGRDGSGHAAAAMSSAPLPSSSSPSSSPFPSSSLTNEEKRDIVWWSLNRHLDTLFAAWEDDHRGSRLADWACSTGPDGEAVWQAERADALAWLERGVRGLKRGVRDAVVAYGGVVGEEEAEEVRVRVREWASVCWPGLEEVMARGFERGWVGVRNGFWAVREEEERRRLGFE